MYASRTLSSLAGTLTESPLTPGAYALVSAHLDAEKSYAEAMTAKEREKFGAGHDGAVAGA